MPGTAFFQKVPRTNGLTVPLVAMPTQEELQALAACR